MFPQLLWPLGIPLAFQSPSKSYPRITQMFNWFLKLFWFHFGCQNGSPKHPKRHKINKKTAQARKIRLFENEHLAYTKHSFSRVQGAKNTPKVNQSRSEGLSKITSIFASILGLIFLNFESILGSQSQPFGTHNHPLGAFWDPQPFPGPSFGTPSQNCCGNNNSLGLRHVRC